MDDELANIQQSLQGRLITATSTNDIDLIEIEYLGRKGKINALFSQLKTLSVDDLKSAGKKINNLKLEVEAHIASAKKGVLMQEDKSFWVDPTLPGNAPALGSLHVVTQTVDDIRAIFSRL